MTMDLRNRLQSSLECSLPSTLTFKYPTIKALVDYLAIEVFSLTSPAMLPKIYQNNNKVQPNDLGKIEGLSKNEIDSLIAKEIEGLQTLLEDSNE